MSVTIDYLVGLVIIAFPFQTMIYVPDATLGAGHALQPLTIFSVFLMVSAFRVTVAIMHLFENPFVDSLDLINVDNLMASTDCCIFASMRAQFDDDIRYTTYPRFSVEAPAPASDQ